MQAIVTKYLPATNTKPSRIKAKCERGSLTVSYPHDLSGDECHEYAARTLVLRFCGEDQKNYGTPFAKNSWMKPRIMGGLPGGNVAHVFIG